ncbi:MAG TPA: MerR family transcriptional regulator [Pseudolabrys sp.]|nr:MerR family transcriptional regulator [Pseudolabrys sp.]
MDNKAPDAFRTISEVADELDLPQHVLRFWESRFREIKPMKRGGGRRYYRPDDIDLLRGIRHLLYGEGYTIRGVQRILREQGSRFVEDIWREAAAQPSPDAADQEDYAEEVASGGTNESDGESGLGSMTGPDLREHNRAERHEPRFMNAADHAAHQGEEIEPVRDLEKLHAALSELSECRKLIDAVLASTD